MDPYIINGDTYGDRRGTVAFVNDFSFEDVERFYIVENSPENPIRGWQGHKYDTKYFYCIVGSFEVSYVKIDDWGNPSPLLEVQTEILTKDNSRILCIPAGHANLIKSLEPGSRLMSFSTLSLNKVEGDDVRYDVNTWPV